MPVLIFERSKSRPMKISADAGSSALTLTFVAIGSINEQEVMATCLLAIPVRWASMWRQEVSIDPQKGGIWYVEARYSPLLPKQPGEPEFTFDTGGGTQHITVSKETLRDVSIGTGVPAPDYKGAIGVDGETVHGCDIHVRQMAFSYRRYVPAALVTADYRRILFLATTTTNNAAWKGFEAGEVLFIRARGAQRGTSEDPWEINFEFLASPNLTVPIGNTGETEYKRGWEYLWIRFADKGDGDAKCLVKQPVAAYVERVYDESDFSQIGLGV